MNRLQMIILTLLLGLFCGWKTFAAENVFIQGGEGPFPGLMKCDFGNIASLLFKIRGMDTICLGRLSYGPDQNLVVLVPVGGIDHFNFQVGVFEEVEARPQGWKVETVFAIPEASQKNLDDLRGEYAQEIKKLQREFEAQNRAMAEKVRALRVKFEGKANELLPAEVKVQKEKLDALSREHAGKQAKAYATPLADVPAHMDDYLAIWQKWWCAKGDARVSMAKAIEVITQKNRATINQDYAEAQTSARETLAAMQAVLTGDSKNKLADLVTARETRRGGKPAKPAPSVSRTPETKPEKPVQRPDDF